uniref:Uncharacterized protein n=1 Tax=Anguilla anguilla TaxID=7936 RepID=A0A0E9PGQ7_ANGAN
MFCRQCCVL